MASDVSSWKVGLETVTLFNNCSLTHPLLIYLFIYSAYLQSNIHSTAFEESLCLSLSLSVPVCLCV